MNGDYWPSGLLAELVQISQGGEPPQDIDPERFAEMARRAAKEIAHRGIRNPVLALTQERESERDSKLDLDVGGAAPWTCSS